MRWIKFEGGAPYCGTEFEDIAVFDNDTPDSEINEYAEELAHDNGETYSYLHTGWEGDFEDEDDEESYYEDCWCNWEEITQEKYERIRLEGF